MFYETGTDHGLPYDPFKACVVPRAIGWISTRSSTGIDNLAPYSQFTNLTFDPPYVMFSSNRINPSTRKDSVNNAISTGVFCWNLATYELRHEMNISAQQLDSSEDEFLAAGLEKEDAKLVAAPLVKRSPVKFECQFHQVIELPGNPPMGTVDIVIGRVLAVHIADEVLTDGKIDVKKTVPIARLGYFEYAVVRETFEMRIPGLNEALAQGLEGNAGGVRRALGGKEKGEGEDEGEGEGEVDTDETGTVNRPQVQRAQSAAAGPDQ